jgi:hypothetical protein
LEWLDGLAKTQGVRVHPRSAARIKKWFDEQAPRAQEALREVIAAEWIKRHNQPIPMPPPLHLDEDVEVLGEPFTCPVDERPAAITAALAVLHEPERLVRKWAEDTRQWTQKGLHAFLVDCGWVISQSRCREWFRKQELPARTEMERAKVEMHRAVVLAWLEDLAEAERARAARPEDIAWAQEWFDGLSERDKEAAREVIMREWIKRHDEPIAEPPRQHPDEDLDDEPMSDWEEEFSHG